MEKIITPLVNWYCDSSPLLKKVLKYPMKPFIILKIRSIGKRLIKEKRWKPSIAWSKFRPDGSYINIGPADKYGVHTDTKKTPALLVGCFRDQTVGLVYNVPEQYRKVGATF